MQRSGLQRRISLIKPEKSREEPKSSAAGERKELILKSKSLLLVCWAVCMRARVELQRLGGKALDTVTIKCRVLVQSAV